MSGTVVTGLERRKWSAQLRGPALHAFLVFSLLTAALPGDGQDAQRPVPDALRRRPIYQRSEWFWEQRAYPLGFIPGGARQDSLRRLDRMLADQGTGGRASSRLRSTIVASSSSASTWSLIGPQPTNNLVARSTPTAGRVSALALDPGNANIVYAGGAEGGVWKTIDGGQNWTPLTDNQPSLAVGSIAVDPNNTQSIWVGTGEMNFSGDSYYGVGFLHSTDAGATWTQIASSFVGPILNSSGTTAVGGARIGALAIQPGNSNILLAGVEVFTNGPLPGIYRSTDGGATWNLVLSGAPGDEVVFDPTNPNIVYATLGGPAAGSSIGFYRSSNSGQTWTKLGGNVLPVSPAQPVGRIAMAVAHNVTGNTIPTTIYLGIGDAGTGLALGVYKSIDGGTTWSQLTNAPNYCQENSTTGQCMYDNVVRASPVNDALVFIGGASQAVPSTLYRSLDGGATWSEISSGANSVYLHSDTHALAFSPNGALLYVGNDGGIWSTTDISNASVNWTNLNSTLAITEFYPGMSLHPTDIDTIIGGTQDNGTQLYSGNMAWSEVACGDGGWTAIDFANPDNVYASCQKINVRKSTSAGAAGTFFLSETGVNTADRVAFIPPLVIDPNHSQVLYYGTYRLYRTADGAGSWTAMANGADLTLGAGHLNAIAVVPGDGNTVWLGTSDGQIQVSANASLGSAATFLNMTANLPNRAVTQVAVDPNNVSSVYVTLSGFNFGSNPPGHVFRITTGVTPNPTWQDISGDLPNTPVNDIVIDPLFSGTLYIATDIGVFRSTNGGTNWAPLVSGLPRVVVMGLKLHQPTRTLVAATHGRSVWSLVVAPVAAPSPTIVDFGAQIVAATTSPQTVTLTNSGNLPLSIASFGITSNRAEFALTGGTCAVNSALAVGDSCTLNVTFTPSAGGSRSGALAVRTNAVGGTTTVPLTGSGSFPPGISLLPGMIAFGNQLVYDKVSLPATLFNNSASAISLSGVSVTGAFVEAHNCPTTLVPGSGCAISVSFNPQALGGQSGALTVNAAGGSYQSQISGTAVDLSVLLTRPGRSTRAVVNLVGPLEPAMAPAVSSAALPGMTSKRILYAGTVVSASRLQIDTGAIRTITIRNPYLAVLRFAGITISRGFTAYHDCPAELPAGAACTVSIHAVEAAGRAGGTLQVRTSRGTVTVELTRSRPSF